MKVPLQTWRLFSQIASHYLLIPPYYTILCSGKPPPVIMEGWSRLNRLVLCLILVATYRIVKYFSTSLVIFSMLPIFIIKTNNYGK